MFWVFVKLLILLASVALFREGWRKQDESLITLSLLTGAIMVMLLVHPPAPL